MNINWFKKAYSMESIWIASDGKIYFDQGLSHIELLEYLMNDGTLANRYGIDTLKFTPIDQSNEQLESEPFYQEAIKVVEEDGWTRILLEGDTAYVMTPKPLSETVKTFVEQKRPKRVEINFYGKETYTPISFQEYIEVYASTDTISLYHGTSSLFTDKIMSEGLKPPNFQQILDEILAEYSKYADVMNLPLWMLEDFEKQVANRGAKDKGLVFMAVDKSQAERYAVTSGKRGGEFVDNIYSDLSKHSKRFATSVNKKLMDSKPVVFEIKMPFDKLPPDFKITYDRLIEKGFDVKTWTKEVTMPYVPAEYIVNKEVLAHRVEIDWNKITRSEINKPVLKIVKMLESGDLKMNRDLFETYVTTMKMIANGNTTMEDRRQQLHFELANNIHEQNKKQLSIILNVSEDDYETIDENLHDAIDVMTEYIFKDIDKYKNATIEIDCNKTNTVIAVTQSRKEFVDSLKNTKLTDLKVDWNLYEIYRRTVENISEMQGERYEQEGESYEEERTECHDNVVAQIIKANQLDKKSEEVGLDEDDLWFIIKNIVADQVEADIGYRISAPGDWRKQAIDTIEWNKKASNNVICKGCGKSVEYTSVAECCMGAIKCPHCDSVMCQDGSVQSSEFSITPEMEEWFEDRTVRHIALVQKYCGLISEYDIERFRGILERGDEHDASKFEEPERTPYIYVSWDYHCKDTGEKFKVPADLKDKMSEATRTHCISNSHHPEFHSPKKVDLINRENRDAKPKEIVDATAMPDLDIAEMVSDWCAMGSELGNSPKEWADKNVNIRWKFTPKQTKLIYELIDAVWDGDK